MTKKEARKIFREKRRNISSSQKAKWDDLILIQFQKLSLPFLEIVLSFLPIEKQNEVGTLNITRYLQFLNPELKVAYPMSDFTNCTMKAVVINDETEFVTNEYGIAEPVGNDILEPHQINFILVPLLCFDKDGYRVGYGKGFYDKFLSRTNPNAIKAGLSYFEPIDKIADRDNFDVTLDFCITPQAIYEF